jgi:hypothetical protein
MLRQRGKNVSPRLINACDRQTAISARASPSRQNHPSRRLAPPLLSCDEEVAMHALKFISAAALTLGVIACDDTGKAIKEEVKEIDKQEVKQDLKAAASAVGSAAQKVGEKVDEVAPKVVEGVKDAAKETEKAIDKVDKKAAEEIRRE